MNTTTLRASKYHDGPGPRHVADLEFVTRNRLTLSRSQDEILVKARKEDDIFGSALDTLYHYLPYEAMGEFLKDGALESYIQDRAASQAFGIPFEGEHVAITDPIEAAQDMVDYLWFGYRKAVDERGLSASRTISKLSVWAWLLGRQDLEYQIRGGDYAPYGAPILIDLAKSLGLEPPAEILRFAGQEVAR